MYVRSLRARHPAKNADANPTSITGNWLPVKIEGESMIFLRAAPVIIGVAKRNTKRVVSSRFFPSNNPPDIVAPERETPGKSAAAWKMPIIKLSPTVIARGLRGIRLWANSAATIRKLPIMSPTMTNSFVRKVVVIKSSK